MSESRTDAVGPPFRADHVGSLLRSERLLDARERTIAGELDREELRQIEDDEISRVVKRQEDIGLQVVTDGEFRRAQWHFDFLVGLDGVEFPKVDRSYAPEGDAERVAPTTDRPRVTGKLGFTDHPMLRHFAFVRDRTSVTPKITIPAPSVLHFRNGRAAVDEDVYPDLAEFFHDAGEAYRLAVQAFGEAGCRYLQLDETSFAYLCDENQRAMLRERGEDPDELLEHYTNALNAAASGAPEGMTVTMHMCRGNNRSNWHAQGGYEPIAETAFNRVDVSGYFMEYDSDRAGGFEPLRHLPAGKRAVLGMITTKVGALEDPDAIKRRIDEAARYADVGQLCLSPQCGFASIDKGNKLLEDEQWRKLETVVAVARDVW